MVIVILSIIGFFVSLYGYIVEKRVKGNPDYQPMCDISENISCSKPIKAPHLFSVSYSLIGMIYYLLTAALALLNYPQVLLIMTSIGMIATVIFAYILYFRIKSVCLICTTLYIINIALFILALRLYF